MKQLFVWIFVCCLWVGAANAQDDMNREIDQALADYKAEKYAEALPIFEKYREALEDALKDEPESLKGLYTILATCYQKTGKQKEYEAILPYIEKLQALAAQKEEEMPSSTSQGNTPTMPLP
ncbi:MAG: hypothetical protein NW226_12325 [Microscillaceae bacterium]|nr:hypothetical protein [Microscillaceae bacterium]